MGYDQYTFPDTVPVEPTFIAFRLALVNIRPWPLVSFFQISLKNSDLKSTHNTSRDCPCALFPTTFLEIALFTDRSLA